MSHCGAAASAAVVIFGFGRAAHWLSPRPPVGSLT